MDISATKEEFAPCSLGEGTGEVVGLDQDNKDGICVCAYYFCPVDGRNRVLSRHLHGVEHPYSGLADAILAMRLERVE